MRVSRFNFCESAARCATSAARATVQLQTSCSKQESFGLCALIYFEFLSIFFGDFSSLLHFFVPNFNMNLFFLLALALSVPTALACRNDSDCCTGGQCMYPRGWNPTSDSQIHPQKQCILPGDSVCPQCPFGFSYVFGVCTPYSFPCQESPCPFDKACVYEPKNCFTTPCPQYVCVNPQEACPEGRNLFAVFPFFGILTATVTVVFYRHATG